jgi:siroheme synthase
MDIARANSTLVIYMPGPDLKKLSHRLRDAGLPEETPCLLLSRASRDGQREQRSTLAELEKIGVVEPPSILIVGEVTRENTKDVVVAEIGQTNAWLEETVLTGLVE